MEKLPTGSKWELLGALYKHGSQTDLLEKELPKLNRFQIKKAVGSYRTRAQRKLKASQNVAKKEPIDKWNEFIDNCHQIEGTSCSQPPPSKKRQQEPPTLNNYSFLLQKSMTYAACFEEHYQGSNPEDPNYNEIYRYLAQLLNGEQPTQLRPGNAKKIIEMMSKLKKLLDNKENINQYLNYIADQHSVSYIKPGVDIAAIMEEKRNKESEIEASEVMSLFSDSDGPDDLNLSKLAENDPHYLVKEEKIIKKLSLRQRGLASTICNIPGINPLEMVLPALIKPKAALVQSDRPRVKRLKSEVI